MGRVTFRSAITASETFAVLFLLSFAKRTNEERTNARIISFLRYEERKSKCRREEDKIKIVRERVKVATRVDKLTK